ncbi:hypothetical protein KL939_002676 [Ogataea angusta]|nr:hypothetical protein KL941_004123 [Ogataea angusta]KAG7858554.1 hypothetical protein KL939_002676 [Ogataea angusta]
MLNSKNISNLLSQVLEPVLEITSSKPYSISLLSTSSKKPLVSCFQNTLDEDTKGDDNDFLNAGITPSDNLRIMSLTSMKAWEQRTNSEHDWLVIRFNSYYIYLYKINDEYLVMLCCDLQYPKVLAIKKLEKLSEAMKDKL